MELMYTIFWIVGALLGLIGIILFISKVFFLNSATSTTGEVISNIMKRSTSASSTGSGGGGTRISYHPVFVFMDTSGNQIEKVSKVGYGSPRYQVGAKVEILYNPNNPQKAILNNFSSKWMAPIVLLFVGAFLIGLNVMMGADISGILDLKNLLE